MDAVYLTKTFMWSAISPGLYNFNLKARVGLQSSDLT